MSFNVKLAAQGAAFTPTNSKPMDGVVAQGTVRDLFKAMNVVKYGNWFNTNSKVGRKMMTFTTKEGSVFSIMSSQKSKVEAGEKVDLNAQIIQRENGSFFTVSGGYGDNIFTN